MVENRENAGKIRICGVSRSMGTFDESIPGWYPRSSTMKLPKLDIRPENVSFQPHMRIMMINDSHDEGEGGRTSSRKKDHVDLCVGSDVRFRTKRTGLERFELVHNALPELDFD